MIIALCSGINSCVGIFIYLTKHQELKEYFLIIFPRFAKIKDAKGAQVGTTHSQLVVSTLNTASRNSLRRSSLMPQVVAN